MYNRRATKFRVTEYFYYLGCRASLRASQLLYVLPPPPSSADAVTQTRPCHNIHIHLLRRAGDRQDASNHVAEFAGALAYQPYTGPVPTEAKREYVL